PPHRASFALCSVMISNTDPIDRIALPTSRGTLPAIDRFLAAVPSATDKSVCWHRALHLRFSLRSALLDVWKPEAAVFRAGPRFLRRSGDRNAATRPSSIGWVRPAHSTLPDSYLPPTRLISSHSCKLEPVSVQRRRIRFIWPFLQ